MPSLSAPLDGIRVVSVDNYLAGNYGPQLLAMMGAEVIKVEVPGRGDVLRDNAPFVIGRNGTKRSHGEIRLMRGKKSVALDIRTSQGRDVLRRLISVSHVFWTNLKQGSLTRLGIDYGWLKACNDQIVYTTLSGFGHNDVAPAGPDSDLSAFDIIAQGLAGLQFRPEGRETEPVYNGLAIGDQVTSIVAALGTLAALRLRDKTGSAQRVDVAMFDVMVTLNEKTLTLFGMTGEVPERGRSATSAPFNAYPTKDGYVNIAVGGNPVWERFCDAIVMPELAADERYRHGSDRVKNSASLDQIVSAWTSGRTTREVLNVLVAKNVPAAPLREVDELIDDPQALARRMVQDVFDPATERTEKVVGNPIKIAGCTDSAGGAPHNLGDDTWSTLVDLLELSTEELQSLAETGALSLRADKVS